MAYHTPQNDDVPEMIMWIIGAVLVACALSDIGGVIVRFLS